MTVAIVSLVEVGDPVRIEPLVRAVHGEGDRACGWFARKLHRECVVPELSRLAIDRSAQVPPTDPACWVGYTLVGAPPSTLGTARTCGGGVIAPMRRRGVGRALFEAAARAASEAGFDRLHVPATRERVSFFEQLGFARRAEIATVLTFASGSVDALPFGSPLPWDALGPSSMDDGVREHAGWSRDAWERTQGSGRATVEIDGVVIHLAREGIAVMAHRVLAPRSHDGARVARALDRLRERVVAPTPTLVTGVAPVSSVTACPAEPPTTGLTEALTRAGWAVVQEGALLERQLRPSGVP